MAGLGCSVKCALHGIDLVVEGFSETVPVARCSECIFRQNIFNDFCSIRNFSFFLAIFLSGKKNNALRTSNMGQNCFM